MKIAIAGAGAFGTGLSISLASNGQVTLWARDSDAALAMAASRENTARLPNHKIPGNVLITSDLEHIFAAETILLAKAWGLAERTRPTPCRQTVDRLL
jgi:glycerol-3-phosphate dehydrogenase (NAD(P)+)